MKYLCIDTSASVTGVAAVNGEKRKFITDDGFVRASRALMPMIDSALEEVGLNVEELDFICVVIGPGSFTGVRIGVSTARAIAYVKNLPVVTVNSCRLAAYNSMKGGCGGKIFTVSDAGNGYVYFAAYDGETEIVSPSCIEFSNLDDIIKNYTDFTVAADKLYAEKLGTECVTGDGISELAGKLFTQGETVSYNEVQPLYVRASQAEREIK